MPKLNFWLIVVAFLVYFPCSAISLKDRVLVYSLHHIEKESFVSPSSSMLFEGAMSGMVRKLNYPLQDDYSSYIPHVDQSDFEDGLDNRFEGIGMVYQVNSSTQLPEVIYPILNSPAFKSGLRTGDTILSVDGQSTQGLSMEELSRLFRGLSGTEVVLSVLPFQKQEAVTKRIKRASLQHASVEGDRLNLSGHRIFVLQDHPTIGYIRITSFSDRTTQEMQDALKELEHNGAKSLILDLRDNPGGYVLTCVQIAGFFVKPTEEHDTIVSTRHRDGTIKAVYKAENSNYHCSLPMVVLIDGESASASEILAACLQDYQRATIVGTRSFGKGTVQKILKLPLNAGLLRLTDAGYWRPSNRNIHRAYDAKESDPWGVSPEEKDLVPVSDKQRTAQLWIRTRRSNILCSDAKLYWDEYLQELPKEIDRLWKNASQAESDETTSETDMVSQNVQLPLGKEVEDANPFMDEEEPAERNSAPSSSWEDAQKSVEQEEEFVLQGNAPFYDPQLDKAIEILSNNIDGQDQAAD